MRKEIFPENGSQKVHQFLFSLSCRQGTEKARTNIPALNCVTDAGLPKKESPHSLDVAYPGGFEPLTPRVGVWYSIQLSYGYLIRISPFHAEAIIAYRSFQPQPLKKAK